MKYTSSMLDALRDEGDPLADRAVTALLESGEVADANLALHNLRRNKQLTSDELPPVLRDYLLATKNVPEWMDHERVARAHEFFRHDGIHVASSLSLGAMVGCYAVPVGAKILSATHQLNHPHRRMSETTQFILHMMAETPFAAEGQLITTIQKVRLIHAAVRQLLIRQGQWDRQRHGVPICQEDMLCAALLFSVGVLAGMGRLGVHPSRQEAEDYYYIWRVTATMLGVRPEIVPETVAEASELLALVEKRQSGPSPEGVELTSRLLQMYEQLTPSGMRGVVPALIRRVTDHEIADWMEVPRSHWGDAVAAIAHAESSVDRAEEHHVVARKVLDKVGRILLNAEIRKLNHGQSLEFDVPATLLDNSERVAGAED